MQRYQSELSENDTFNEIMEVPISLQDVLDYAESVENCFPRKRPTLMSFKRLGPMLRLVDDFSAMLSILFGADIKATALIWGSIRLILSLASTTSDKLQNVLDMLEELSFNLPEFRSYERSLPMTPELESSLLELYTQIICFYARTIHFLRDHPHIALQRQTWSDLQNDFGRTLRRIRRMSSRAKTEADVARMKMDEDRYKEVLELVTDLKETKIVEQEASTECYFVPQDPDVHFCGRDDELNEIRRALDPDPTQTQQDLRTFAIYGMGGVGKTQVALQYAKQSRPSYNVTIWIAAETSYSIGQSSRDAGLALGLLTTESEHQDLGGAVVRLRNWLKNTGRDAKD